MFRLNGPPIAVKPRVDPLLRLLGFGETTGGALPPPSSPAVATPQVDLAAQIAQLASLRDSGVLTNNEFAAAKARLLA